MRDTLFEELVIDTDEADNETRQSEICLANLYHPKLHAGHPSYDRLPIHAMASLARLQRQTTRWEHQPYFSGGVSNRTIAILNGYHRTDRLLRCMMVRSKFNPGQSFERCSLPSFCPFCAYLKGQDILKKYGQAWQPGYWHWLVFSLEGFVCLDHFHGDNMLELWDAMRACIKRFSSSVDGYVGWEELAVNSFWPVIQCTPHVNVLIRNPTEPDLKLIAQTIAEEWESRGLSVTPDPQMNSIKSEAHFYSLLKYVKPIDLMTAYDSGFLAADATGELELLHRNVRHFFEGYAEATTEYQKCGHRSTRSKYTRPVARRMYFYAGKCHGSVREPLGVKPDERRTKEHQEIIRTRVLNAGEDELQFHDDAP